MHCVCVDLIASRYPIANRGYIHVDVLNLKQLMHMLIQCTHIYGCNGMQALHSCLRWSGDLESIPCITVCTHTGTLA